MKQKSHKVSTINYQITIGWLYPEFMNTYGDRGNIIVLQKRCEWRGIDVKVNKISINSSLKNLESSDLIFMGGAQDTQQEIVNEDLFRKKGKVLKDLIEKEIPGLYICGAYQFLGKYYKTADGKKLPGLGVFPAYTTNDGNSRLIGNIIVKPNLHDLISINNYSNIIGFENHGGRTYLEDPGMAFGTVIKGQGNNGLDKSEGIIYKNSIGSYLHGPILPKNPELSDWLIQKALEKKYKQSLHSSASPTGLNINFKAEVQDDWLCEKAKAVIAARS